mmetsp:Transcript_13134/g.15903  ORF Transcript_13134/g.15903 Transcript_13134/m.15903 type:complete len:636 (-) Transcript_13134:307-2214(-)|eukprot:CAMPEP_0197856698 /NCGR_PEP_ID=MMETSP1438-20131217/29062_1 /TAXON_ID=1461541 /ORGANISM="Pterosperma sp., Strain CCMP1384" /LENGTH=635 /DNA_ID=CAMNT_0043472245 /DNA_START=380 /DNA_END=2287 /DNA_ORIENTATION=+
MLGQENAVVIVVCGAAGTGKTSLITAIANESFPQSVPPTLPPTRIPASAVPDDVDALFVDTSSREEDKRLVLEECKNAHVVVMTYSVADPASLFYLRSQIVPSLRKWNLQLPVLLVGCKGDLRGDRAPSLEQDVSALINDFHYIETCLECSAKKLNQVQEVVHLAQKAVLHPTGPLFDTQSNQLKTRCVHALRRIFILCDQDKDGALNDHELNEFQVRCFGSPLQPEEIVGVKKVVRDKLPSGVTEDGTLTLAGFLFLHALFIERGRMETTWTVLRQFGYDNTLSLREDLVKLPFVWNPEMCVELTAQAQDFLRSKFDEFVVKFEDEKGCLTDEILEEMFSTAPCNPWVGELAVEGNWPLGMCQVDFMAHWALTTHIRPQTAFAYLLYLGYKGDASSALQVTRRRRHDRRKNRIPRTVFQCFVLGPYRSGKSAILDRLIGQPQPMHEHTAPNKEDRDRLVAGTVDQDGDKCHLILHEPRAAAAFELLSNPKHLVTADVAVLVFDSSCAKSFQLMAQQLHTLVEMQQFLPVVVVAARDDLGMSVEQKEELESLCETFNIPPAVTCSMKNGDAGGLYSRIVNVAQNPEGNIPLTASMKAAARYQAAMHNMLRYTVATTAVGVLAVAAWKVYSARKNS